MTGRKILIVEDEPDSRSILSAFMERRGYEVLSTGSGRRALALIKEQHPDLVFLDMTIDELDGMHVLRTLRADKNATPVVLLTGQLFTPQERAEIAVLGVTDLLEKPVPLSRLAAMAEALVVPAPVSLSNAFHQPDKDPIRARDWHKINNVLGLIRNSCESFVADMELKDYAGLPAVEKEARALGIMRDVIVNVDRVVVHLEALRDAQE